MGAAATEVARGATRCDSFVVEAGVFISVIVVRAFADAGDLAVANAEGDEARAGARAGAGAGVGVGRGMESAEVSCLAVDGDVGAALAAATATARIIYKDRQMILLR